MSRHGRERLRHSTARKVPSFHSNSPGHGTANMLFRRCERSGGHTASDGKVCCRSPFISIGGAGVGGDCRQPITAWVDDIISRTALCQPMAMLHCQGNRMT